MTGKPVPVIGEAPQFPTAWTFSIGLLKFPKIQQFIFPRVNDPRENKPEATVSFRA